MLNRRPLPLLPLLLGLLAVGGCTATTERGEWGAEATLLPGWSRVKEAAQRAASDRKSWLPLAGAVLLYGTGQDEKISDWAVEQQPIFGSRANDASSELKHASTVLYDISVVATPSGDTPAGWLLNKAKGAVVGSAAFTMVGEMTDTIKERAARRRPNGTNTRSFISGHTSYTAAHIAMAMRNSEYLALPTRGQQTLQYGLYAVTLGSAWSRVEAGAHYPSDVLAAMALSNFVSNFMFDAFLAPLGDNTTIHANYDGEKTMLYLSQRF